MTTVVSVHDECDAWPSLSRLAVVWSTPSGPRLEASLLQLELGRIIDAPADTRAGTHETPKGH